MSSNVQPCDFRMRAEKYGEVTVVILEGELDIAAVPPVITELRALVARDKGTMVLDVRGLAYIDSAGLAVIASTLAALTQEGRSLLAVGCHGIFEKILHLTQLDRDLHCFATMQDALQHAEELRMASESRSSVREG